MNLQTGAARVDVNIVDYSVLISTALKGITGYIGVTERGEPGKQYKIGTWDEYLLNLGGLVAGNDFPLLCYRALTSGARLVIVPAGKYTNPTDKTTLSGVKATLNITQSTTAAAGATAVIAIPSAATAAGTLAVIAKVPGAQDIVLTPTPTSVANADANTAQATALAASINANTGTSGFSAVASGGNVTVTFPVSYGAWGRNIQLSVITTGGVTVSNYLVQGSGGSDALTNAAACTFTAKAKGVAYNKVKVAFTPAPLSANFYTITVSITDGTVPDEVYSNIPKLGSDTAMAAAIANIIANSRLIGGMTVTTDFKFQPMVATALTAGTDGTALVPTDYIGDINQGTNLRAFDTNAEITKICAPAVADGTLAKAIADYVDARKDLMGLHRTPVGIAPDKVLEYRLGTGAYSHAPINSWRNMMFAGGINVINPADNLQKDISEIGDVTGLIARKDNRQGEWFSFAGDKRGTLANVNDVVVNVGTGAYRDKANDYDAYGIIPVIKDAAGNIKIYGNTTLYRTPSLLQRAEVAELMVFVHRSLNQLVPLDMFDPNDPQTWKGIYRRVVPFIQYLIDNRALWNKRDEVDLWYRGDQHITDISQATVNNSTSIDNGQYEFKLYLKPKTSLKYLIVTVAVTNSGIDFKEIAEAEAL